MLGQPEIDILKWGLTQGGLVIIVLILLWSYRRDFTRLMARDEEKIAVLTDLIGQTRSELAKSSAVVDSVKGAVDDLRRAIDRRPGGM